MLRLVAVLSFVALTGCQLYAGDDEPPPPCAYGVDGGAAPDVAGTRDPYTGECYYNYPPQCDERCGPCPEYAADIAAPYGATCYGACSNLDESSCTTTPGCHATYDSSGRTPTAFAGCWDIAPLPVISNGQCDGLDAYTCAQHDDCVGLFDVNYGPDDSSYGRYFSACAPESSGNLCTPTTCGPGSHCEDQCATACPDPGPNGGSGNCETYCSPTCIPDTYTCANVDCGAGYMCVEQCDAMDPTTGGSGYCFPTCVEVVNNPGECNGEIWCDAIPPACPANTVPGTLNGCYSGYCIPLSQCGPQDPGTCDAMVTCGTPSPACPANTVPGVKNGCYTGYCIPDSSCPQLQCEALTDENSCLNRADCTPVYTGNDCTCFPDGTCSCTSQSFARCETWWL